MKKLKGGCVEFICVDISKLYLSTFVFLKTTKLLKNIVFQMQGL